jgi:hypothetical protein
MTQTPDYSFPQLNSNSEPFENDEDVDFWPEDDEDIPDYDSDEEDYE